MTAAAPAARGARWRQVPEVGRRPADDALARVGIALLAVLVGSFGPALRAFVLPEDRPTHVFVVCVLGSLAMAVLGGRWWPLRLLVPLVVGAELYGDSGRLVAGWAVAALYVADWGVRGRKPLPFFPSPGAGAVAPVVVLSLVASWQGADWDATYQPIALLALAALLPLLARLGGGALDRFGRRLGERAAQATSWVGFNLLGLVVVVVPWAIQRVIRLDPLHQAPHPASAWQPRDRRDVQARQPWTTEASGARPSPVRRLQGAVSTIVVLALLWTVGAPVVRTFVALGPAARRAAYGSDRVPPAMEGADWYPAYHADIDWIMTESAAWRPLRAERLVDVTSRYVNVVDGVRTSWQAPACDGCRRLTVWMYGGSTTFGLGQRDDHTIASELARAAWDDGIVLDVVNRGVSGQLHWSEAQRFAWDLTEEDPPDLVLFYDGYNELWATNYLSDPELAASGQPIEPLTEDIWSDVRSRGRDVPKPDDAELTLQQGGLLDTLTSEEFGELAVARYTRSLELSRATADHYDVPTVWSWQPTLADREDVEGEPFGDDEGAIEREAATYDAAHAALPDDVVDLSGAFDGIETPLYLDGVHHNEVGARAVAAALYAALGDQLAELEAGEP